MKKKNTPLSTSSKPELSLASQFGPRWTNPLSALPPSARLTCGEADLPVIALELVSDDLPEHVRSTRQRDGVQQHGHGDLRDLRVLGQQQVPQSAEGEGRGVTGCSSGTWEHSASSRSHSLRRKRESLGVVGSEQGMGRMCYCMDSAVEE